MVSTVASQQEGSGFESAFLCGVCVFSPCVGFFSGYSGFSQPKDMQVRLIGDSKLPVALNASVNGCLSLCVNPVIDLSTVYLAFWPMSAGIGSKPSHFQFQFQAFTRENSRQPEFSNVTQGAKVTCHNCGLNPVARLVSAGDECNDRAGSGPLDSSHMSHSWFSLPVPGHRPVC